MHPFLLGADHVDNTTALDLLAWTVVLLGVTTALLRDRAAVVARQRWS